MTGLHRALAAAAALGIATVAALTTGPVAHAAPAAPSATATVTDASWWTKRPGAAKVAPGYVEVANGFDGNESVAALAVDLASAVDSVTIQLTESGGIATSTAALRACTTDPGWAPANAGALADAPTADCGAAVALARDASGTWTADLTPLLAGHSGVAGLMIVPDAKPVGGVLSATWSVQLSPALVRATPAAATAAAPAVAATTASSSGPSLTPITPSVAIPSLPSGHAVVPSAPPTTTAATVVANTAAGSASAPPAAAPRAVAVTVRGEGKPWGRLLFLVPLSVLGGWLAVVVRGRLAVATV